MELDIQGAAANAQPEADGKKVKISFDEFRKLAIMIITMMKEYERAGDDNVRQGEIAEKIVIQIELHDREHQTSIERSAETLKKVNNVINYLINNENILMISQDAKVKSDRYLTLNVNCDLDNLAGQLQGSKEM